MIAQLIILLLQLVVSPVGTSLERLHTAQQVVKFVHGVSIESFATAHRSTHQILHHLLQFFDPLDSIVGRVLACKHVHESGHVETIALDLWQLNRGSVLQSIDLLRVLINDLLVCSMQKRQKLVSNWLSNL